MKASLFVLLAWSQAAWAFQCPRDHTIETAYGNAERAFLVYVTETRLEDELLDRFSAKHPEDKIDEDVKFVSAGYRIIENYKGAADYQPRLVDMLGIGTGYVGITPGVYYLVFLPPPGPDEDPQMRLINVCTLPLSHYRLNEEQFQQELQRVRNMTEIN